MSLSRLGLAVFTPSGAHRLRATKPPESFLKAEEAVRVCQSPREVRQGSSKSLRSSDRYDYSKEDGRETGLPQGFEPPEPAVLTAGP